MDIIDKESLMEFIFDIMKKLKNGEISSSEARTQSMLADTALSLMGKKLITSNKVLVSDYDDKIEFLSQNITQVLSNYCNENGLSHVIVSARDILNNFFKKSQYTSHDIAKAMRLIGYENNLKRYTNINGIYLNGRVFIFYPEKH